MWTALMVAFAKFAEGFLFRGAFTAWCIGVPFIVVIVLTNRDNRTNYLLTNVMKFQTGDELNHQFLFILKLMDAQATKRHAAVLLDGYIELHKKNCDKEDCPLKQKNAEKQVSKTSNFFSEEYFNEKYALLIKVLNKMYYYGIKKFPASTSLRISFAFFLIEKLKMKQQALQELNAAELSKPDFDEEFKIFRYRKIIEDEIAESKNEQRGKNNNLDIVSEIAFQNQLRSFHLNVEKAAIWHMEFWSDLQEDAVDLAKLDLTGFKIHHSVNQVEEHLNKLQKISLYMPKAMRFFGKYLIEIMNDIEAGNHYLETARNQLTVNNKKSIGLSNYTGTEDITESSTPTVLMSGEPEKLGIITGVNSACSSIFGYSKSELINRNVNVLLPQIFAKHWDQFLENFLSTGELKYMNKEKSIFGRYKNNYIFPVFMNIKPIQNSYQMLNFVATFRREKYFKNQAYLLVNPDTSVDSVSAACIRMMKCDSKMIMKQESITQLFSDIFERKDKYMTKTGAITEFYYPYGSEFVDKDEPRSTTLNVIMSEIRFLSVDKSKTGHIVKCSQEKDNISGVATGRLHKPCTFQFKYCKVRNILVGEFTDNIVDDLISEGENLGTEFGTTPQDGSSVTGNLSANTSNIQGKGKERKGGHSKTSSMLNVDYGAGIKILRLVDGKAIEIIEDSDEEGEGDGMKGGEKQKATKSKEIIEDYDDEEQDVDDFSQKMFYTMFKSRKNLHTILTGLKKTPAPVIMLNITGTVIFLILIILAVVDYAGIFETTFNEISTNIEL
jgi:PAS domain S-box-containing protein